MKKGIWMSLLAIMLFVSACNQQSAETSKESSSEEGEQEEVKDKKEEEKPVKEDNTTSATNTEDEKQSETDADKEEDQTATESTPAKPQYELTESWDVKPIDDAEEKVVLLTIDDAPDKHALQMAKTLKDLDAPAIFFVNGHFLNTEEEKNIVKEIHDMGFAIGNHTMDHQNLTTVSQEEQKAQITPLSNLIEEVIGERPEFFRAPHGANTDYSKQVVEQENMLLMNWTYGYDWNKEYMTEDAIADIMVNTNLLHNGANLLMHDREWTAKALDDIVKGLREKGYTFVNPDEIKTP
ncbi:polysaccharide deacetylase family protein [Pontibacillus salicampi]|uniref:Polysaccharide deacetylase family protein n=1 Tax=Pontibacillus salicampi TaxID=1449801 RepID=A0ABV6LNJ0_9BACI